MPFDALVVGLAVTAVFVGFAGVLAWMDHWSRQAQAGASSLTETPTPKRRGF